MAWQGHRGDQKKQNLPKARKPKAEPGHYRQSVAWQGYRGDQKKSKKSLKLENQRLSQDAPYTYGGQFLPANRPYLNTPTSHRQAAHSVSMFLPADLK